MVMASPRCGAPERRFRGAVMVTLVAIIPRALTNRGWPRSPGWRATRANAYTVTFQRDYDTADEAMWFARHAFGARIAWGIEGDVRV